MIGDAPRKWKYTTARKYRGDDSGSWAVFTKSTGQPYVTGLYKSEVKYWRGKLEDEISARMIPKNFGKV